MMCDALVMYRARRSEARIQQMMWKVNYSDIVFVNTVWCIVTVFVNSVQLTKNCSKQQIPNPKTKLTPNTLTVRLLTAA